MKSIFACLNTNNEDISELMVLGLHALQHRGEDGFKLELKNQKETLNIHGKGLVCTIKETKFNATLALGIIDYH